MSAVIRKNTLSCNAAESIQAAVLEKAQSLNIAIAVTLVDESGHMILFKRMDGAPLVATEAAKNKATTALFGLPTDELYNQVISQQPSMALSISNLSGVCPMAGGVPLYYDNCIVGAVGVSGGTLEQDGSIAMAGADSFS